MVVMSVWRRFLNKLLFPPGRRSGSELEYRSRVVFAEQVPLAGALKSYLTATGKYLHLAERA